MQGGKNWILTKDTNKTGSSETLIGWKSRKTTDIPLWDRMEGTWLWTLAICLNPCMIIKFFPLNV
jgi:hypothetical protein